MFKHTIAWLMDIFIFDEICISTLDNVKRMGALIGASSAPSLSSLLVQLRVPGESRAFSLPRRSALSVTEADPTFEILKDRRRKGLREYAQLPRLHSRWSFSHGSKPAFLKSSFFRR